MRTVKFSDWMKDYGLFYESGSIAYALLDKGAGLIQAAYDKPEPERMLDAIHNLVDESSNLSDFDYVEISDARMNKGVYYLELAKKG